MFDQFKMAADLMKNMSPEEMKKLIEQARESQKLLEQQVRSIINQEIKERGLVSKEEVERLIQEKTIQA